MTRPLTPMALSNCPRPLVLALLLAACPGGADTSTGTEASTAADTAISHSDTSATMGATTGTSTGTAPTSGADDTTSGPPGVECVVDADCQLIDDCCECAAAPTDAPSVLCDKVCDTTRCGGDFEIAVAAHCRNGVCALAAGSCDGGPACGDPPPACDIGTIPAVAGACWGACQAPNTCQSMCNGSDPGLCGVGWVCVESQSMGGFCEPVPLGCNGVPTCDCLVNACEFGACSDDGQGGILCQDGG